MDTYIGLYMYTAMSAGIICIYTYTIKLFTYIRVQKYINIAKTRSNDQFWIDLRIKLLH